MRAILISILLYSIGAVPSWAQYHSRVVEIQNNEVSRIDHEDLRGQVTRGMSEAFSYRSDRLAKAVEMLRDDSTGNLRLVVAWHGWLQESMEQLVRRFRRMSAEAQPIVDQLENPESRAAIVPFWLRVVGSEQGHFVTVLRMMRFAQLRDTLIAHRILYNLENEKLVGKWDKLTSDLSSAHSTARDSRANLIDACDDLTEAIQREQRALRDFLGSALPIRSDSERSSFKRRLSRHTSIMASQLKTFDEEVQPEVARLQGTFRQERASIVMFTETRALVETFMEGHNISAAEEMADVVEGEAGAMIGEVAPEGNKRDLADFVEDATASVTPHLASFRTVYSEFIDDFEGRFVFDVSSSTKELFLKQSAWNDWASRIHGYRVKCRSGRVGPGCRPPVGCQNQRSA